jgi:hypothetical protein
MCQFSNCMTETKALGFCIVCGKEICSDCADKKNPKKHTSCIILRRSISRSKMTKKRFDGE